MGSKVDSDYNGEVHTFVDPSLEMNLGLWFLFAGATIFLALRLYCKAIRRNPLWYDDYILLASWVSLRWRLMLSLTLRRFEDGC